MSGKRGALALAALLMVGTFGALAQAQEDSLRVWEIEAVLEPPFTYYSVEALDSAGGTLTYAWTLSDSGTCDDFTSEGATASWHHDNSRCEHDTTLHRGTIRVRVSNGKQTVERVYTGGSASHDPGEPDWRVAGTSFFGGNEEGDDPRDFPPPAIYGEELDCPARDVAGAFEPVQAVWQDENTEIFPEAPGRRLTVESPRSARAELPLVVGKLTQLFGTRDNRAAIHYNGSVTGTDRVPAVVRWSMTDASGTRVLGEIDVGDMPLGGDACAPPTPFALTFDTKMGLQIRHFLPKAEGEYTIVMELAERGGAAVPGSQVLVDGPAKKVHEPRIYFVPVTLRANSSDAGQLVASARRLATESATLVPDYWPLPSGGFHTIVRPAARDMRPLVARAMTDCAVNGTAYNYCFEERVRAGVESHFAGGVWQLTARNGETVGVDRVAIIVSLQDMDEILYPPAGSADGFAAATKTFFLQQGTPYHSVVHEFAHTLPTFVWLSKTGCTVEYHNGGPRVGHGFQLSYQGAPARIAHPPEWGIMQGARSTVWVEQCTYAHILDALNAMGDPRLVGIRGTIERNATGTTASFDPGMTFDGIPDRAPGGEGPYAMRLLGPGGALLAEHRFDHPFVDDWGRARTIVAFSMAVERPEGLARIELVGEDGVLAAREVTPNAPTLQLTAPDASVAPAAGAPLRVAWSAADADGDALTYGVAFSADDGETWHDVDWDRAEPAIDIPAEYLALGNAPRIRVTATDGVNSAEVERALGPRTPTSATPTTQAAAPDDAQARGAPGAGVAAVVVLVALVALGRRRA